MKIIIIGNGIAGNQVAFTLRQQSRENEICIISAENVPEYDPCSLPYFLGGDVEKKDIFRKKIEDYAQHNIKLVFNNKVVSIDPEAKSVTTDKGLEIGYDKLVLAHGGDLFIPPIEGIGNPGVFSCKQLLETEKLFSHNGSCAVVIGSGAIGIEVAEALKKKGYQVYIIELLDWILPALFDEPTAKRLETAMEGYGIHVCTGEKVLRIKGDNGVTSVVTDKQEIKCDTVVVATGVVPGTLLAKTAGIETGRGIQVNQKMETSVQDIYACGDCVETIDACTGEAAMFQLKHNAIEQGLIVAKNISGENAEYLGAHAFARAHFFKTHAATFGKTIRGTECLLGQTEIFEKESGKDYLRVVLLDGRVIGGQAIGKYADTIGLLMSAMWRKDDINLLKRKWKNIVQSKKADKLPQIRLGHIFGFGS
ncbi:MAG: FAD-dependent oxidoreductase [Proteobacteria bacterium]|nr:FAD-dependent oxidoreductase [Pseudomonadota bacterium]MBU1582058.1 FAD-dependent oxidoreductase [Pseudomonadota bacterium]MBU2453336.1 FAD-dependent oxidoreductase [Pseudomonadota bacterium]MBU2628361.1 FAD-dependent oxidoreductase [Pseudomonadota bacterium]